MRSVSNSFTSLISFGKFLIVGSLLMFSTQGCDPVVVLTFSVQNNTDNPITVKMFGGESYSRLKDTNGYVVIAPSEKKIIWLEEWLSVDFEKYVKDDTILAFDSLKVMRNAIESPNLYTSVEEWELGSNNDGRRYTLHITEQDFN